MIFKGQVSQLLLTPAGAWGTAAWAGWVGHNEFGPTDWSVYVR